MVKHLKLASRLQGAWETGLTGEKISIGCRVPKEFFVTSGAGESDITIHAGSFDEAMRDAGIENYNLMHYSSIMPAGAVEVERPEGAVHGSVLETIMAVSNSETGVRATAGVVMGWVYDKRTGKKIGGLVAEHNSHEDEEHAVRMLRASVENMFKNRYGNEAELRDVRIVTKSIVPEKRYGTAMVVVGFTSYEVPVLN
ncbi:MAG: pyruvoyl-dependent arginine decarboxylase [Candidatus Aenigmatarchaeota archaeon]|nr:MAG: pyruvoyl-dependent arginine decarboxylase [Candidatus Aenigmarchaeota archaeon]